jgi:hypothetical protein
MACANGTNDATVPIARIPRDLAIAPAARSGFCALVRQEELKRLETPAFATPPELTLAPAPLRRDSLRVSVCSLETWPAKPA